MRIFTFTVVSTGGPRKGFESGCALKDGLAKALAGLTNSLYQPSITIVRSTSDKVIDVTREVTQMTPDLPNWIDDDASGELSELLPTRVEICIDLPEEFR